MKIYTFHSLPTSAHEGFRRDFRQAPRRLRACGPWQDTGATEFVVEAQAAAPWPVDREFFIAYADDGTLLATCGASLSLTDVMRGFIGFFEAADSLAGHQAAQAILTEAQTWLRAHGASQIVGPVNLCTWFPYRAQAEPYSGPWQTWEPSSPLFYLELWSKAGFVPLERYFSEAASLTSAARTQNASALMRAEAAGFKFRPFERDPHRFMLDEVPLLHQLTLAAFADNFLFEPLPLSLFRQLYVPLLDKLAAARFSWFALAADDTPCGFLFAFEENRSLVVKTVAVAPSSRGHGLQMALLQKAIDLALDEGIETVISALLKEGIASEKIPALFKNTGGVLWRHCYVLLEKQL